MPEGEQFDCTGCDPVVSACKCKLAVFPHTPYDNLGHACRQAIKPEWTHDQNGNIRVQRPGVMLLEFATADQSQGSGGYGERKYDWGKKQVQFSTKCSCMQESFSTQGACMLLGCICSCVAARRGLSPFPSSK